MPKAPISIRSIETRDCDALYAIDQACFPHGVAYSKWEIRWFLSRRGAFGYLAELESGGGEGASGSSTVGFVVAWKVDHKAGHIITLDILEPYRRRRIGSALMKKVEEEFHRACIRVALLEVSVNNTTAQQFYRKFGYEVSDRLKKYYPTGEDAFEMVRWFEEQ